MTKPSHSLPAGHRSSERPIAEIPFCLLVSAAIVSFLGYGFGSANAATGMVDKVGQLSCTVVDAASIRQQKWNSTSTPFGFRFQDWDQPAFAALRERFLACQNGVPISKLEPTLALIDHLSQIAPSTASDRTRPADQRSVVPADSSSSNPSARFASTEEPSEEASRNKLRDIRRELYALPNTPEALERVNAELKRYRHPDMTFSDQNRLYEFLNMRAGAIEKGMRTEKRDRQCEPVLTNAGLPVEFNDILLLHRHGGFELAEFLCAAAVGTGQVSFEGAGPTYSIQVGRLTLSTLLGRYVADRKMFLPPNSPLKLGSPALMLTAIENDAGERADFSDIFTGGPFITNLYAQFAEAYDVFINQK